MLAWRAGERYQQNADLARAQFPSPMKDREMTAHSGPFICFAVVLRCSEFSRARTETMLILKCDVGNSLTHPTT
jgi:hypothetical protein